MNREPERGYGIPARAVAVDVLLITALFSVSLIFTNPFGDFPLNDDWSFGLAAKRLIEHGGFHPTGWTSMPLLTNALWGAAFCIPAGFSFTALRISTLTLSLLGVLATYFLMRELRQARSLAILAALTLAFTPVYYALSHTFMTDVPCAAITTIASVFFVRNLRTGSSLAFGLGTILAALATLSRQLAISVPIAFAIALILKAGFTKRNLLRAAIPPVLCVGALLGFQHWLAATGRLPALYTAKNDEFFLRLARPATIPLFAKNAYQALLYLGCFLLPFLLFVYKSIYRSQRIKTTGLLIFSTAAIVIVAQAAVREMKYSPKFSADDVNNLPEFVNRLRGQSDGVSAFLWQSLSNPNRAMLMEYQSLAPNSNQVRNLVAQDLNDLIEKKCIYEPDRFRDVSLRPETSDLLKRGPTGPRLARLNRLLLEDAYPTELSRKKRNSVLMTSVGNIIIKSGIGPLTLYDAGIVNLERMPALPGGFWLAVGVISLIGATLLIIALGLSVIKLAPRLVPDGMDGNEAAGAFLLLSAMVYLCPLLATSFFDRYLIPALPFLITGIAGVTLRPQPPGTRIWRFTAAALLCAFACFAVCGTRDYLAWNRLRWQALYDLMEKEHIKAEDIDGGLEFNGWYMYDPHYKVDPKKSWWWVQGDTYRICFGSIPDYSVIKEYSYSHWMPPQAGSIVVLKKKAPEIPTTAGDAHANQGAPADSDKPRH